MELETDEVNLRAGSDSVDEIDLYDALIAFSNLSPEEQQKELAARSTNDSEPAPQSANEFFFDEPITEPVIEEESRSFELIAQPSFEVIDEPAPPEPPQKKSDYLDLTYLMRVTGPLAALSAMAGADSSPLVCKDCGSAASGEDMFCVTCGGLLDEAAAPEADAVAAVNPVCDTCASPVEVGEIFCPSCGAVLEGF